MEIDTVMSVANRLATKRVKICCGIFIRNYRDLIWISRPRLVNIAQRDTLIMILLKLTKTYSEIIRHPQAKFYLGRNG